ncbi:hypothetical protein [Methanogenium cariaci]|uniref:hypothetical protein n=1 Tax=Methanogenium cariaci TaxID=2197 RepID=UPI0012F68F1A|nr:hypothetical protein [Methanogenium cariaci]
MGTTDPPLDLARYEQYKSYSYLIVPPDGADGDKAQMMFNDCKYRSSYNNPGGNSQVSFAYIRDERIDFAAGLVQGGFSLDIKYCREQNRFKPGGMSPSFIRGSPISLQRE